MKKTLILAILTVMIITGYGGMCDKDDKKTTSGSSGDSQFWYNITIYVKDSTSGATVGGMGVLIYNNAGDGYQLTTDSTGKAVFPSIYNGGYKVKLGVNGGQSSNGYWYITWDSTLNGYPGGIDFTNQSSFTVYMERAFSQ